MTEGAWLLGIGFVLICTPTMLARRDGCETRVDLELWLSRLDFGRRMMVDAMMLSGMLLTSGGAAVGASALLR